MLRRRTAPLALVALVAACSGGAGDDVDATPAARPTTEQVAHPLDDELRLNHVQALGTHNSYHVEPVPALAAALAGFDQRLADSLAYTHRPLAEQLGELGIRQLELDVFADPEGGRWTPRSLFAALGIDPPPVPAAMAEPGLKVFHVQEIDATSTCPTFRSCLTEIEAWSTAHPGHVPVLVLVEAKDAAIPDPLSLGFTQPLPFDEAALDALDADIRSVFDEAHVLTPDDVRRGAATLEGAVLTEGWPTLGEVRGTVLFALDNTDVIRDRYLAASPVLAGRALFTSSEPGRPDAAFLKRNDPLADGDAIRREVAAGYLVRTRADADTAQARTGDTTMAEAALASGAHYVSTDHPVADERFTDYSVSVPDGTPARCNPVSAPPACSPTDVEDPAALTR